MTKPLVKPLIVTMGEAAGVGPDIIIKAWLKRHECCLPEFYVIGDADFIKTRASHFEAKIETAYIDKNEHVSQIFSSQLPVWHTPLPLTIEAGSVSSASANYTIDLITQAVTHIRKGYASGLVTSPIHKATLYGAGFNYPGHTEFLASLSNKVFAKEVQPVMMLASDELKVVPATIHIALSEVADALSKDLLIKTTKILSQDLTRLFGIESPRIIMTGLNPHAGEEGAMGREEIEIIAPAIKQLRDNNISVNGPYSADSCFHKSARKEYDAVIAMYHDQALIPFKTLYFDEGVNVTLGLPFVRTSPDHGTALDIAGSGKACPESFIAALRLAADMAKHLTADLHD